MAKISLIASVAANGTIGKDNKLICYLADDMKRFVQITKRAGIVVMGRKTFDSIGFVLPGRINLVVTRQEIVGKGAIVVKDPMSYIRYLPEHQEVLIIGGASIYKEFLPLASKMYITNIQAPIEGDTYFPEYNELDWKITGDEFHPADEHHRFPFIFNTYERIQHG